MRQQFIDTGIILIWGGRIHQDDGYGIEQYNRIQAAVAKDSRLSERVIFLDNYNVWEAPQLFQGADFSMMLSDDGREAAATSPQKLMMNGGLPIASSDGVIPEFITPFNGHNAGVANGFKVSSDELKQPMVNGLRAAFLAFSKVYRDKPMLTRMVRNAINQSPRISVTATAQSMLRLLDEVENAKQAMESMLKEGEQQARSLVISMELTPAEAARILSDIRRDSTRFIWKYKEYGVDERTVTNESILSQNGAGLEGFIQSWKYVKGLGAIGEYSIAYHSENGHFFQYISDKLHTIPGLSQPDQFVQSQRSYSLDRNLALIGFVQGLLSELGEVAGARMAGVTKVRSDLYYENATRDVFSETQQFSEDQRIARLSKTAERIFLPFEKYSVPGKVGFIQKKEIPEIIDGKVTGGARLAERKTKEPAEGDLRAWLNEIGAARKRMEKVHGKAAKLLGRVIRRLSLLEGKRVEEPSIGSVMEDLARVSRSMKSRDKFGLTKHGVLKAAWDKVSELSKRYTEEIFGIKDFKKLLTLKDTLATMSRYESEQNIRLNKLNAAFLKAVAKKERLSSLTSDDYTHIAEKVFDRLKRSHTRRNFDALAVNDKIDILRRAASIVDSYIKDYLEVAAPIVSKPAKFFRDRPHLARVHRVIKYQLHKSGVKRTLTIDRTEHLKIAQLALDLLNREIVTVSGARMAGVTKVRSDLYYENATRDVFSETQQFSEDQRIARLSKTAERIFLPFEKYSVPGKVGFIQKKEIPEIIDGKVTGGARLAERKTKEPAEGDLRAWLNEIGAARKRMEKVHGKAAKLLGRVIRRLSLLEGKRVEEPSIGSVMEDLARVSRSMKSRDKFGLTKHGVLKAAWDKVSELSKRYTEEIFGIKDFKKLLTLKDTLATMSRYESEQNIRLNKLNAAFLKAVAKKERLSSLTSDDYTHIAEKVFDRLKRSHTRRNFDALAVNDKIDILRRAASIVDSYIKDYLEVAAPIVSKPAKFFRDRPHLARVHRVIKYQLHKSGVKRTLTIDRTEHLKIAQLALDLLNREIVTVSGARMAGVTKVRSDLYYENATRDVFSETQQFSEDQRIARLSKTAERIFLPFEKY